LLRSITVPVQYITSFCRQLSGQYLRQVIRPIVLSISSSKLSFEVDPLKEKNSAARARAKANLVVACSEAFDHIARTIHLFPRFVCLRVHQSSSCIVRSLTTHVRRPHSLLHDYCRIVHNIVAEKFPDGGYDSRSCASYLTHHLISIE